MHSPTSLAAARIIAPGGPVTRALAVMAAPEDTFLAPQFQPRRVDLTALAIGTGCILCWLSPAALWIGGSL